MFGFLNPRNYDNFCIFVRNDRNRRAAGALREHGELGANSASYGTQYSYVSEKKIPKVIYSPKT